MSVSSTPLPPQNFHSRALFFLPSKHHPITPSSRDFSASPSYSLPSSSSSPLVYPSYSSSPSPSLVDSASQQQQQRYFSSFSCNSGGDVSSSKSASPLLLPPPSSFSLPSPSAPPPVASSSSSFSLTTSDPSVATPFNALPVSSSSSSLLPQTRLGELQPRGSPRNLSLGRSRREEEENRQQSPSGLPGERRLDEEANVSERSLSHLPQSSSVFLEKNNTSECISLDVQDRSSQEASSLKGGEKGGCSFVSSLSKRNSDLFLHRGKSSPREVLSPQSHLKRLGLSEKTLQMLQSSSAPSPRPPPAS